MNKQRLAAEEAGLERRAATLKLMVEQQKIAESKLLPLQKENKLNKAMHEFKMSILKIDKEIADQTAKDIEKRAKDFEDQLRHQEQLRFSLENQNRIFADIEQFKTVLSEVLKTQLQVQNHSEKLCLASSSP